jgi:hypothetical protein
MKMQKTGSPLSGRMRGNELKGQGILTGDDTRPRFIPLSEQRACGGGRMPTGMACTPGQIARTRIARALKADPSAIAWVARVPMQPRAHQDKLSLESYIIGNLVAASGLEPLTYGL